MGDVAATSTSIMKIKNNTVVNKLRFSESSHEFENPESVRDI